MNLLKEQLGKNKKQLLISGIIIVALVIVGVLYFYRQKREHTYYAVFMTNNQVYFGNLSDMEDKFITLKNVAYIFTKDPNKPQEIQLVKRGSEAHNPTGDMEINRDQVLFVEELTSASQVTKTIEAYKQSQIK